MKPRVGDMVRLKPVSVTQVDRANQVQCYIGGCDCYVHDCDIEEILPRPLAVNDRVVWSNIPNRPGTIRAIENGYAWVFWETKGYITCPIETLTVANADSWMPGVL